MYHNKKIYRIILTLVSLFTGMALQAQNLPITQTDIIKIPGITQDTALYTLTPAQLQSTRVYYDGLNRPIQQVGIKASPLQKDLIQATAYDNLGRQTKGYLPYAGADGSGSYRADALTTGQAAFYNSGPADKIADDSKPYSNRVIENSPLQRLLQAGTVGAGFQPGEHYTTVNYRSNSNTVDGAIIKWLPDGTRGTNYNDTTLTVNEATDAAGKTARTFTDKNGHVVLKRQVLDSSHNLDTYYVYNDAGNLSFTVPPKAVKLLTDNPTYTLTQTAVAALIYKYKYDDKGRLYIKTIPSAGDVYMIYDPLDRLVLVQDGNLRLNNRWYYMKYDVAGRVAVQGAYTDATNNTQALMQAYVDGMATSYNTAWFEKRNNSASFGYYTNTVFPTTGINVLTANYYDDYDLNQNGAPDYTYSGQGLTGEATATTVTRGMLTITRTVTVGSGLTSTWLTKVIFYDKNGRQIQVQSNNQLVTTMSDVATSVPDFTGATLQTKVVKYHAAGTATTILTTFTYDHVYRLNSVKQKYNTGTESTVATYQYNELGQMVDKKLGISAASPSGLQSVDYRYNIRGQLLSINNSKLADDHTTANTNDDTNDVFGEELSYDQTNAQLSSTGRYDGSITAVKWMSLDGSNTKSNERGYRYQYDGVGRFTQAVYAERLATATAATNFSLNADGFTEKITGYDENGNIQGLMRYSSTPGGSAGTKVDGLRYNYDANNPNRLLTITDSTANNGGFQNYTGATTAYTYYTNGNLRVDPYKGINPIGYNMLNRIDNETLTYNATGRKIDYTYDATGKLIRKRQIDNSVVVKTTDYIDGFVYTADGTNAATLAYFGMPEGRVRSDGGVLKQEFIITDHQGNARISFEDNGSGQPLVKQENSYYAFGMSMTSTMAQPTAPNKNLYNGGSEWQNDFSNLPDWQQTFYRNYDAVLGRWLAVDPMAEQADDMSVYHYGANNPVMFNDPLGDYSSYVYGGRVPQQDYSNGGGGMSGIAPVNGADARAMAAEDQDWFITQRGWMQYGFGGYSLAAYGAVKFSSPEAIGLALSIAKNNAKGEYSRIFIEGNKIVGVVSGGDSNVYTMVYATDANHPTTLDGHIDLTEKDAFGLLGGKADANQGGWPWSSKSDPASWVFTTSASNRNVQTAGVTGIDFSRHDIRYSLRNDELTVIAVHVRLPTLYFEYPKITNMFFKKNEVLTSGFAALIMARATDRAVNQLRDWFDDQENPTEWSTQIQFMKFLTGQVLRDGGRVTPTPNYAPVIVTPYRRL